MHFESLALSKQKKKNQAPTNKQINKKNIVKQNYGYETTE